MRKMANLLVLLVLFLTCGAIAAINPIGFSCETPTGTDDAFKCSVKQIAPEEVRDTSGFHDNWNDFAIAFARELGAVEEDQNTGSIRVTFESDIDLGGYQVTGKDTACVYDDFFPLSLDVGTLPVTVDGNGNTIKNFCYVADGLRYSKASFFDGNNITSIQNLKFDNAYVKIEAKEQSSQPPTYTASILHAWPRFGHLSISGVSIKNSRLAVSVQNGTVYAGALVGYALGMDGLDISKTVVNADVRIDPTSRSRYAGMLVGFVNGSAAQGSSSVNIVGTSSKGDMLVSDDLLASGDMLGYIVGLIANVTEVNIRSNYHLGTRDVNVRDAIDSLTGRGDWNTLGNFRNAVSDGTDELPADGKLHIEGSGVRYKTEDGENLMLSAVLDEDDMNTRLFAYVMNMYANGDAYWESGDDGYLEIAEKRTAFQFVIEIGDIFDKLTEKELKSLEGYIDISSYQGQDMEDVMLYRLYVYSEKDYLLDPKFVKKMKALHVDYGILNVDGFNEVDLESMTLYGNRSGVARLNRTLVVVYEMQNPEVDTHADYIPMEDVLENPIFMWPKVDRIPLFGAKIPVPPVRDYPERYVIEYYVESAYINCDKNVAQSCGTYKSANVFDAVFFSELLSEFHLLGDYYDDTLHVVYREAADVNLPKATFANESDKSTISLVRLGYGADGKSVIRDTARISVQGNGYADELLMSKYSIDLEPGFVLKKWNVDFWASAVMADYQIEWCYDSGLELEDALKNCNETVQYSGTYPYIANVKTLSSELNKIQKTGSVKWSFETESDTLSMDSLVRTLVAAPELNGLKYHVHLNPEFDVIPYRVAFDVNTDESSVFIDDDWSNYSYSYENEYSAKFPTPYRVEACFDGWSDKATDYSVLDNRLSKDLLKVVNPVDSTFNVYAQWTSMESGDKECQYVSTFPLVLVSQGLDGVEDDYGEVTLWQSYESLDKTIKLEHEFIEEVETGEHQMIVPVANNRMTFHVSTKPNEGFGLSKLSLVKLDFNGNAGTEGFDEVVRDSTGIQFYQSDTSFSIWPASGTEYRLYAIFGRLFKVALDLMNGGKNIFYGPYSKADTLNIVEGGSFELPDMIYTSDACVLGWKFDAKAKDYIGPYDIYESDSLLERLGDGRDLYAWWGSAEECVEDGSYTLARLEAEHGSIELIETKMHDDGEQYVHSFAENSTMLLPYDMYHSILVVKAVPDSGYQLESLELIAKDYADSEDSEDEMREERSVLHDGDTLPSFLWDAVFKASFSEAPVEVEEDTVEQKDPHKAGSLKLVEHELLQSGNAICVMLKVNRAAVDRRAKVQVSLMDELGNVLEKSLLTSAVKDTAEMYWTHFALVPGGYVVHASLFDKKDTVPFDTSLSVRTRFATSGESWQMISLSDVDLDSIVWDSDPLFYSWKETAAYGDYWKYQRYQGGEVDPLRGYWYGSLEGRALVLRTDTAMSGETLEWELDSGWNMMANPFGWAVRISHEDIAENDNDSISVLTWKGEESDYERNVELDAYEAAWVYSDKKRTLEVETELLILDADSTYFTPWKRTRSGEKNKKGLKKAVLAKAVSREDWALQVSLSDSRGHRDSWNILGAGVASELPEPPSGMGDRVNLSLLDGKRPLAKSIRKTGEASYEWNVALSATGDRVGYLKFEGVKALNEMGLKVFVTVDGKTTEAYADDSLKVFLKAAGSTATVRVAPMDARALASRVENLRLEQALGNLQVGFDVTEGLAGANYIVQLVGLDGKVAASYRAKALFGHNTVALDAPKPGLYLLRVRVGSEQATRKVAISR